MNAPQFHAFPDGGFVVHKVPTFSPKRPLASIWVNASGFLQDAEFSGGHPMKEGGPVWQRMIKAARYWKGQCK